MHKKRFNKNENHFSYNDVKYIDIWDPDDIKLISEYLNSLELIEEKIPDNKRALYTETWDEYENKLRELGYFSIAISDDLICFSTNYAFVIPDSYCECDTHCVSYYIKNSGYDPGNKTSNFYNFLRKITDQYS